MVIIASIVLFGVLIFVHELGHFLAAKSIGVRVEKFYLGFNLFGMGLHKKIGDTEYGIGLFPLGGYVKVAGVIDESMDTSFKGAPDELQSKNTLQRLWFLTAGVLMNMILAALIFSAITLKMGVAVVDEYPVVGSLLKDYPSEQIGILPGDTILAINNLPVSEWSEMTRIVHNLPGEKIFMKWSREGQVFSDSVVTKTDQTIVDGKLKTVGMVGIAPMFHMEDVGFFTGVKLGIVKTWEWLDLTVRSLGMIFSGEASVKDIGGPVMIAKLAGESARSGIWNFLTLMAIISINLAFFNVLPIPGLDGGHILITLMEGISRRKLPVKIKIAIQQVGMVLLLSFIVFVIINDFTR